MPTNNPWDGTAWDITAPDIDQPIGNHYKEMFDLRKGVGIRMSKEHITLATSSAGGEHVQGSARTWFQDAVPALQPDGTALAATDNGMLWFDTNSTPDNLAYVLVDHSDPTVGNGWVLLSTSTFAEMVLLAHQWAAIQTFDLQTVHTLGILSNASVILGSGANLVGAADSIINMNAFDVSANGTATLGTSLDIAGTIAVVGTIDDDTMATATDTTVATSESIKAYVDNTVANADNAIKAWSKSTGTTINGGFNVSSVTNSTTGEYVITWTTAFANSNYCVNATSFNAAGFRNTQLIAQTTTTATIEVRESNGTKINTSSLYITAIGDQ